MANVTLRNVDEFEKKLRELRDADFADFFAELANAAQNVAEESFENEKSPDGEAWETLSGATLAKKAGKGKKLWETGHMQRSLNSESDSQSAVVGLNARGKNGFPYPAAHQWGTGNAGRGNKTKIPARPFLPVDEGGEATPRLEAEIADVWKEFLDSLD